MSVRPLHYPRKYGETMYLMNIVLRPGFPVAHGYLTYVTDCDTWKIHRSKGGWRITVKMIDTYRGTLAISIRSTGIYEHLFPKLSAAVEALEAIIAAEESA